MAGVGTHVCGALPLPARRRAGSSEGGSMKAWQFSAFGGPDQLQLREVGQPTAGAGEALVRVTHCGVNPIDASVVGGRFSWLSPPHTPGTEIVGIVAAIGESAGPLPGGPAVGTPV